jgi:hypothetical protein
MLDGSNIYKEWKVKNTVRKYGRQDNKEDPDKYKKKVFRTC